MTPTDRPRSPETTTPERLTPVIHREVELMLARWVIGVLLARNRNGGHE